MMIFRYCKNFFYFILFISLCSSIALAENVIVTKKDGTTVKGKLDKETWKEISMSLRGGVPSKVNMDDVVTVQYEKAPAAFQEAERLRKRGTPAESQEAIKKYQEVATKATNPKWSRHYAYFHLGSLYSSAGDYDTAIASLSSCVSADTQGRFSLLAVLKKGECFFRKGELDKAQAEFSSLKKGEYGSMQYWASFWLARILETQTDYTKAGDQYRSIAIQSQRYPSISELAKIGEVRVLYLKGEVSRALSKGLLLTKGNVLQTAEGNAALYNVLGDCKFHNAKKEDDADKKKDLFLDAVIFFLHVDVQYPVPYEHPYALQRAAEAYAAIGQADRAGLLKSKRDQLYPEYKN